MTFRNTPLELLVCAVALVAANAPRLGAQAVAPSTYLSAEAGLAVEPALFSVRSSLGLAVAAGIGRYLSMHRAVEARLGTDLFGAPSQFTSPGGCLGQVPCNPPQASQVGAATLAGDVVVMGDLHALAPLGAIGVGVRYITESPEHSPELRPFAEIGGGVAHSFGAASFGLEARWQLTTSSASLPRWTMPIAINVRFF